MAHYRKKPVVIEAHQFEKRAYQPDRRPQWLIDAVEDGTVKFFASAYNPPYLLIKTLKGYMRADIDDWIIKGVKGEIYPCKPEIFAATYDLVTEPDVVRRDRDGCDGDGHGRVAGRAWRSVPDAGQSTGGQRKRVGWQYARKDWNGKISRIVDYWPTFENPDDWVIRPVVALEDFTDVDHDWKIDPWAKT